MDVNNVLLPGAGGKMGRAVLPELLKAGHSVRALEYTDRLQVPRDENVVVVTCDRCNPSLAKKLIEDVDVVKSIVLAIGNWSAAGEAFSVSGPAPFGYDILTGYVAEKLELPIVRFEVGEFNDFSIDMSKFRSVLGFDPECDIFGIVDDALQFRQDGKTRSDCPYPG